MRWRDQPTIEIYPQPTQHIGNHGIMQIQETYFFGVIVNCCPLLQKYRVVFLTGPPDFQYQNEKTCSANEEIK